MRQTTTIVILFQPTLAYSSIPLVLRKLYRFKKCDRYPTRLTAPSPLQDTAGESGMIRLIEGFVVIPHDVET